jgi:hypothetical protein
MQRVETDQQQACRWVADPEAPKFGAQTFRYKELRSGLNDNGLRGKSVSYPVLSRTEQQGKADYEETGAEQGLLKETSALV